MTTTPPPIPSAGRLRAALADLGFHPCAEHAPVDPAEEAAGLLGALLAVTQSHIQRQRPHADTIDAVYHHTRTLLGGFPPCPCGSVHDDCDAGDAAGDAGCW